MQHYQRKKLKYIFLITIFVLISCSKTISKVDTEALESLTLIMNGNGTHYHFLLNLPKHWKNIFENKVPNGVTLEFIPETQNLASWRDMITLRVDGIEVPSDYEYFNKLLSHESPLNEKTCKNFKKSALINYDQFGYKTIEYYLECPSSTYTPGAGEVDLYKYILAGDKVGLIQVWKSWKIINDEDLARARSEYDDYTKIFRTINLKKAL